MAATIDATMKITRSGSDVLADFQAAYQRTYIERDARLLADVSDWQLFGRFMRLAAALTAQEINHSELGRELGLPDGFVERHPFPGPGLAIRIPGEVTREKLDILRKADAVFLEEIRNAGLYGAIWQAFAVLLPVRSVGVMGDSRSYDFVCALRAVTSTDGMTADYFPFPHEFLGRTATRIINEVRGINRVVYDITSKPPGTIEWE